MYPILGRYGPFLFYTYTAVMGLGLFAAAGLAAWRARHRPVPFAWADASLVTLFAALLGGRLAYVAGNWVYFQENLDEILLIWEGGLSYHGALAAGLLALWSWARVRALAFGAVAGFWALPAVLWNAFVWLACYLDGCAYGRETLLGLLAADLPDSYGVYAVRYQSQLLGLGLSILALLALWLVRRRARLLFQFWLALFLVSLGRFVVSLLRGDAMPLLYGVRLDTVMDGALALFSALILLIHWLRRPSFRPQSVYD